MKRLFICFSLLFSVMLFAHAGFAQELEKNPIPEQSKLPASANEAATFANSLGSYAASAQFLCEAHEGAPTYPEYRALYYRQDGATSDQFKWQAKEGIESLEAAKDFVNGAHALARFVACRQRYGNTVESTVTVFYIPNFLKDGEKYEILGGEFNTAEDAVVYADKLIGDGGLELPSFVPKFSSVSADTGLWHSKWQLIALSTPGDVVYPPSHWSVAHYGSLELALRAVQKRSAPALDDHYVASFSVDGVQSSITLFSLIRDTDKVAERPLVIPARIYMAKTVRSVDRSSIVGGVKDATKAFSEKFGIELALDPAVYEMPALESSDPHAWLSAASRPRGTLAIVVTDQSLALDIPASKEHEAETLAIRGFSGRGAILVRFDIAALLMPAVFEHTVCHELGHEFGADHDRDENSVMCTRAEMDKCKPATLEFDARSAASILGGKKAVQKLGLETYSGLRTNVFYAN